MSLRAVDSDDDSDGHVETALNKSTQLASTTGDGGRRSDDDGDDARSPVDERTWNWNTGEQRRRRSITK
jgi:hypothetical protein